jgi:potassium efflux system protein
MDANRRRLICLKVRCAQLLIALICGLGALLAHGSVFAQARNSQSRGATPPARAQTKPADGKPSVPAQASSAPTSSASPTASLLADASVPAAVDKSPNATDEDELALDRLAACIKELEAATDDSQPDRAKLLELYHQAEADAKSAGEKKTRAAELDKKRIAAPYQLQVRKRASAAPAASDSLPANKPLSAWEEALADVEQELSAAEEKSKEQDDNQKRCAQRRLEIPPAIAAARIKLEEMKRGGEETPADESPELDHARMIAARAARRTLQADIAVLEKELQSYDEVSDELATLDQEAAAQAVAALQKRASAWRDAINDRRQAEADREAAEAHWTAATAEPAVRQLADENSVLADEHQQITKSIDALSDEGQVIADQLKNVKAQFDEANDKLKSSVLTPAAAGLLRKERQQLAAIGKQRRAIDRRQQEVLRVQLELSRLEDETGELRDLDARAKELAAELSSDSPVKLDDIRALLKSRRTYLADLVKDENLYYQNLIDVNAQQQQLLTLTDQYRSFIDERLLWTASARTLSPADLKPAASAAAWLVRPANWGHAAQSIVDRAKDEPLVTVGLLAIVAGLWSTSRWLRRAASAERFVQSLAAMLVSAARWPATLLCLGWLLSSSAPDRGDFPTAIGSALCSTAAVLFPLSFLRRVCRGRSQAQVNSTLPEVASSLARHLTWLTGLGTPAIFALATIQSQPLDAWKDSLGRMVFIALMLQVAAFLVFASRPNLGPLFRLFALRGQWLRKLSLPTLAALTAIPLTLISIAALGYYDTALQLVGSIEVTIWLVLGVVLAHKLAAGLLQRVWLRLSENPMRPDLDIAAIALGSYRLLRGVSYLALAIGLALVWADIFPALARLDQITLPVLYHGPDPAHSTPVSLLEFIAGCAIAAMTFVAARNLPGLVEFLALRHFPLDAGLRYAMVAAMRYSIAIVGLLAAGGAMGIGWPKLQWLVAAISFGLGFGLQEIFANFVSGLIVLMERPMRIGDTVTVGDMTGVVSRIQMRATTILDADRKELIVPNKEFITSRLVNWTLSDSIIRLVVRIGLPYGTDTDEVQRLLLRVAGETPGALVSPPPKAVLVGFSEKTLDFELRVFVADVESLMPVRHRLNTAIEHALRDAQINFTAVSRDAVGRQSSQAQLSTKSHERNQIDRRSQAA